MSTQPAFSLLGYLHTTAGSAAYSTGDAGGSGSYTPAAGRILCAVVIGRGSQAVPTSVSGNGLSWEHVPPDTGWNNAVGIAVYVALTGASPSAGNFTANFAGAGTGCHIFVIEITGAPVTLGTALAAIRDQTGAASYIVASSANNITSRSLTLAAAADANSRMVAAFEHASNEATTPRTNWTEPANGDGAFATPNSGGHVQWRSDAAEATASASWATSVFAGGIAFEVLGVTTKSDSDTGAGADEASLVAALSGSETGAGTDAASWVASASDSDAAAAIDGASLVAGLAGTDAGTASEADLLGVAISSSEAGAGSDADALTASLAGSENGSALDAWALDVALNSSETGALAETDALTASLTGSDVGSAIDSPSLVAALASSEAALAAEVDELFASLAAGDLGEVLESASVLRTGTAVPYSDYATAALGPDEGPCGASAETSRAAAGGELTSRGSGREGAGQRAGGPE